MTGPSVLVPSALADQSDPVRAWTMAMHVHSCFSEGTASMESQLDQAAQTGVDVLWWSEHEFRMQAAGARQVVHFNGASEAENGISWTWAAASTGTLLEKSADLRHVTGLAGRPVRGDRPPPRRTQQRRRLRDVPPRRQPAEHDDAYVAGRHDPPGRRAPRHRGGGRLRGPDPHALQPTGRRRAVGRHLHPRVPGRWRAGSRLARAERPHGHRHHRRLPERLDDADPRPGRRHQRHLAVGRRPRLLALHPVRRRGFACRQPSRRLPGLPARQPGPEVG